MESAPKPAPTVLSSRTSSGAGRAPERSSKAKSLADLTVKLPLITPLPPKMALWITGAEITSLSRTIAKRSPILFLVASPNFLPPKPLNLKLTTGSPSWKDGWASIRFSPPTTGLRLITSVSPSVLLIKREVVLSLPRRASAAVERLSTKWKAILAVLPSRVLTYSGFCNPGSCTTIRSLPWR